MRSWRIILVAFVLVFVAVRVGAALPAPAIGARAAVLMEGTTGQVLWAKHPHLRLPPASTTKIITALLAIERSPLTRIVAASKQASEADGSSIWLAEGERRYMRELIYGALLNSGNDACVAMAEAIAGSEKAFAALMTARARQLGATETTFLNASGLPQEGHLTSAHDLAVIARAALANEIFAAAVRTKVENIPWEGKPWDRRLINHNKLLWRYEGADGVKTGYTKESGHCLVASATRNGRRLIAVVLGSKDIYGESRALLDYGFQGFTLVKPTKGLPRSAVVSGGLADRVPARPKGVLAYAVPREQAARTRLKVTCPRLVPAPVALGQRLGWAALVRDGRTLTRVPLVAAGKVEHRGIIAALARLISRIFGGGEA